MMTTKTSPQASRLADRAAQSAEDAMRVAGKVPEEALDGLADAAEELGHESATLLNRAAGRARATARHGVDAVRDGSDELRDKAQHASGIAIDYIKDRPLKAMAISAAVGAVLVGLLGRTRRAPDRD